MTSKKAIYVNNGPYKKNATETGIGALSQKEVGVRVTQESNHFNAKL